jgi:(R)-citramalate synthase
VGCEFPVNKPLTGEYVFTQCCGVHADGDNKGDLYFNPLLPERFGRTRRYALGKTSGKASITKNLEELGIELSPEDVMKVTQRVIELGDKKETVTTEDLPYIISDVLKNGNNEQSVKLSTTTCPCPGAETCCICKSLYRRRYPYRNSVGDGQYDAFMKAMWSIYTETG